MERELEGMTETPSCFQGGEDGWAVEASRFGEWELSAMELCQSKVPQ